MHSFYCLVGDICVLADLLEEALLGWRPVTFLHSGGTVGDVWRVLVGLGWPVPLLLPLQQVVGCDGSAPLRLVSLLTKKKELGVSLFGPPPRQTVW